MYKSAWALYRARSKKKNVQIFITKVKLPIDLLGESQRLADTREKLNLWAACTAACDPLRLSHISNLTGHSCRMQTATVSAVRLFASRDTLKSPWRHARSFWLYRTSDRPRWERRFDRARAAWPPRGIGDAFREIRALLSAERSGRTWERDDVRGRRGEVKKKVLPHDKGKRFSQRARGLKGKYRSRSKGCRGIERAAPRSAHESRKVYQITFTIERILTVRAAKSNVKDGNRSRMPRRWYNS